MNTNISYITLFVLLFYFHEINCKEIETIVDYIKSFGHDTSFDEFRLNLVILLKDGFKFDNDNENEKQILNKFIEGIMDNNSIIKICINGGDDTSKWSRNHIIDKNNPSTDFNDLSKGCHNPNGYQNKELNHLESLLSIQKVTTNPYHKTNTYFTFLF